MKFLNMLNRFVSVLLVSVALTAALQFGGVASHAKDSTDFNALVDGKQDYSSRVIDGIFNIPIAALNAVSDLVQTTGPLLKKAADQRNEDRRARAELIKARAADREARNDAKALRRADRTRPSVTYVQETPQIVEQTYVVKKHHKRH